MIIQFSLLVRHIRSSMTSCTNFSKMCGKKIRLDSKYRAEQDYYYGPMGAKSQVNEDNTLPLSKLIVCGVVGALPVR